MTHFSRRAARFLPVLLLAFTAACANTPAQVTEKDHDPLESFNRAMFGVNAALDQVLIRPVTVGYREVVPEKGRRGVSNFLNNLSSPIMSVESFAQLDATNGFSHLWRFLLNTTFGLGGVVDFASENGLKARDTDLGLTLAYYGVPSGPYVYLPIFGPGTLRDSPSQIAEIFVDPVNYVNDTFTYVRGGMTMVDKRSENFKLLDDLEDSSLDPYATLRSIYLQHRDASLKSMMRVDNDQTTPVVVKKPAAGKKRPAAAKKPAAKAPATPSNVKP